MQTLASASNWHVTQTSVTNQPLLLLRSQKQMIMQVSSSSNTRLRISVKDELKEQALGERRKRES
jgi:hypothetical protein